MRGCPKSRTDPECGWYLQWAGILGWNGVRKRACVTRLPDQGSGCPGFPSMMDLLSNHKPTVDSSLHFLLDGYLVPTKSKATNTACLSIRSVTTPFHKACSHQNCHRTCSWTLPFFCFRLHSYPYSQCFPQWSVCKTWAELEHLLPCFLYLSDKTQTLHQVWQPQLRSSRMESPWKS